jgi:hypothetical protein
MPVNVCALEFRELLQKGVIDFPTGVGHMTGAFDVRAFAVVAADVLVDIVEDFPVRGDQFVARFAPVALEQKIDHFEFSVEHGGIQLVVWGF